MAGDWIKVQIGTDRKPEVLRLARRLGLSRDEAFGKILRFWMWVDGVSVDGVVDGVVDADVDALVDAPGFALALQSVGWLDIDADAEQLRLPNFDRHNGATAKKRAQKTKRQSEWRGGRRDCGAPVDAPVDAPAPTNAPTREEKRREEIHTHTHNGGSSQKWPEGWGECKPFCEAWSSWVAHHDQQCRPLTAVQQQLQIMDLRRQVADPVEAARWVCAAVSGGWRRIGKPHEQPAPSQPGGVRRRKASVDEMMGDA